MAKHKSRLSAEDFEFVSNVRSAVLIKAPKSTQRVLWGIAAIVIWFIVWANFAEIDEITRGQGKVIPSGQLQVVQNLEGGIVKEIMVKEGARVKAGQPLLKIDNTKFTSSYEESQEKYYELRSKAIRLEAEANNVPFVVTLKHDREAMRSYIRQERSLYQTNKQQLLSKLSVLEEQLKQRRNELKEAKSKYKFLKDSYSLIKKEIEISIPLAEKGVISEVEILKLKRDAGKEREELSTVKISIPGIESKIKETKNKIEEAKLEFQSKAKKELNEVISEISQLEKNRTHLKDQVSRTIVTSPVDGTVNQLFVTTIGGVVKPGMDLVEIVPSEDMLLIEAKIKPSDIAFLFPGEKAIVKFSAYDFAIYGGLEGSVAHISADTITDEEGKSFFLVRIKTKKTSLGTKANPLEIIPGMTASVDILTGKKTVMDYLLKPIFKARDNALSER